MKTDFSSVIFIDEEYRSTLDEIGGGVKIRSTIRSRCNVFGY